MVDRSLALDTLLTVARRQDLFSLLADGPWEKRALVDELSLSRSTIDRSIRKLETLALVERVEDGYQLTLAGQLLQTEYQDVITTVDSIATVSDVLETLPPDAPMSTALLEGATVTEPERHLPTTLIDEIEERILEADWFRGFAVVSVNPSFRDRIYDRAANSEFDAEAVLTEALFEHILDVDPTWLTNFIVDADCDLYMAPTVPYGLVILESGVSVVIFTESGDVQAVIENDSDAAIEWATDVYRRVRNRAEKISPPE